MVLSLSVLCPVNSSCLGRPGLNVSSTQGVHGALPGPLYTPWPGEFERYKLGQSESSLFCFLALWDRCSLLSNIQYS